MALLRATTNHTKVVYLESPQTLYHDKAPLKTLDTIGKCQRLAFSLAVSQHMHKITNL